MRILTGQLKNKKLLFVPRKGLRPTPDKVREALAQVMRGKMEGSSWLDLFSGTGAIGFEALSNGAIEVCFVESDRRLAEAIRRNVRELGLDERSLVLRSDAETAIRDLAEEGRQFDVVFSDPPYALELNQKVLETLARSRLLRKGGWLVLEDRSGITLADEQQNLRCKKVSRYGDTTLRYYNKTG